MNIRLGKINLGKWFLGYLWENRKNRENRKTGKQEIRENRISILKEKDFWENDSKKIVVANAFSTD